MTPDDERMPTANGIGGTSEVYDSTGEAQIRPIRSVEGWVLFIAGIHEEAQEDDILDKFTEFGKVTNLHLNLDRKSGYAKGYAMVEFEELAQAQAALQSLDGSCICGKQIMIDWAFVAHGTPTSESVEQKPR